MRIMRKAWFNSLNAENRNVRVSFFLALLLNLNPALAETKGAEGEDSARSTVAEPSSAPMSAEAIAALPELPVHVIQKNANGEIYQLGDRVPVYAEVNTELAQGQNNFELKVPEGGSSLEDQGIYLDPNAQYLSGNLRFVISPIQPGKLTLPMLLVLREDKTPFARTAPFTLQVNAVKEEKKEPAQLIDVVPVSLPTKYWVLLGVVILGLAGLIAYLIRRYLKSRKKHIEVPPIRIEAENIIALRGLEQLYQKYSFSDVNMKPIAFGISEILKVYFSKRFQVDAVEATTDEMIDFLRKESLGNDGLKEIISLFQDLDLVKFTKTTYTSANSENLYQEFKVKAQAIVQRWGGNT